MNPKASLIIGILCISFSPIFVRLAGVTPITSAFYRIFIAWVCLAPYCVAKGKLKIGRNELLIAIAAGLVFGADITIWNISLLKINMTMDLKVLKTEEEYNRALKRTIEIFNADKIHLKK